MSLRLTALLPLLLLTTACPDDKEDDGPGDGGTNAFTASGSLEPGPGKTVPPSARVFILWGVSSGSPDYSYKFGEGTSTGARFTLSMPEDPPTAALNTGNIGVGLIALVSNETQLADGVVDDSTFPLTIGASGNYAIIYRARGDADAGTMGLSWIRNFPEGYSCGKGVDNPQGFDTFTPVPCDTLQITVDELDNIDFVNWT